MKGYYIISPDNSRRLISLILSFVIFSSAAIVFLCTSNFFNLSSPVPTIHEDQITSNRKKVVQKCNLFSGNWIIPTDDDDGRHRTPYYTNATNCPIDDRQNCMKFGRPDTEFLRWRWKPDDCELPLFDSALFFEVVKGKSMAFVGDSLARNQMQSLVCLLANVLSLIYDFVMLSFIILTIFIDYMYQMDKPLDVSSVEDTRFRRWFYPKFNFTLAAFWSTHLVKSEDAETKFQTMTSLMNLYLDEVDDIWAKNMENFDYVIISGGQWFLRPLMYYENRKVVGCYFCEKNNVTELSRNYGHKMAFRTSFKALLSNKRFTGITFLRTFSPQHYENGEWNRGGNCLRKTPLRKEETKMDEYYWELYLNQVQELRAAEIKGKKRGLKFKLLDATEMMSMRPDGHPNHYGRGPNGNVTIADCVHWCLPGPVDTWNEILLQMLRMES